jgi:periplasmic protein TonB
MFESNQCLSQDDLLRYLNGQMPEAEKAQVEKHMEDCVLCREAMEGVKLFVEEKEMLELERMFGALRERMEREGSQESQESKESKESQEGNMGIKGIKGIKGSQDVRGSGGQVFWRPGVRWAVGIAASVVVLIAVVIALQFAFDQHKRQIADFERFLHQHQTVQTGSLSQYLPPPVPPEGASRKQTGAPIYTMVEEEPFFPGGEEAMQEYLTEHIRCRMPSGETSYPENVIISFVVEPDGSLTNVKLVGESNDHCTDETIQEIEQMPSWIPGKMDGKQVRVSYMLMLRFS